MGAYYYSWYPDNLRLGTLAGHLVPPRAPDPSLYHSSDPAVAERAIDQASAAGIDFFALDYWPNHPERNRGVDNGFLRARNLSSMRFAMLYETQDLVASGPYSTNTHLTPAVQARLVSDMVALATNYLTRPQYLRIGGRPVIFWYLTRTLTGDVAGAVAAVRTALAQRGYDVVLVADEIFWRVSTLTGTLTTAPQPSRARLFDGITWYNLFDASTPAFAGYGSQTPFLRDATALVQRYRTDLGDAVPIVPAVIPGYNDRGVRLGEGHLAIPRQWEKGGADGSFLQHMFDDLALPSVDRRLPMVMITSWNEWNEDTAVEPGRPAAATTVDDSSTGSAYTQGYRYGGLGAPELDVVRQVANKRS